jgi:pimeloyl-ACP methyl ester carboxylesterase
MADVVLLHGSWLGGWMWADVEALLTADGHTVVAPTLSSSDLDAHMREVGRLLSGAGGTVLVGHSYSGMVATATAAAHPDLIRKVIYLDAYVPRGGQCAFDVLPGIRAAFEANLDGDGNVLPLPLSAFGVTDQRIAAPIESRLRPWPLVTHEQTSPGLPDRVDRVYLQCAQGPFFSELANELESQGWPVERLDLLHLCPITHPAETAAALRPHISA